MDQVSAGLVWLEAGGQAQVALRMVSSSTAQHSRLLSICALRSTATACLSSTCTLNHRCSCRTLLSRYPEALVVPDLTQDVRFKDSPIVTVWPKARFYAACPLVAHTGTRLGTL